MTTTAANGRVQSITAPLDSLGDFLHNEIYPRLTADQVYGDPRHAWHTSPDKWRGACLWHDSKSGTALNLTLHSLLWYCPGCGIGGGPLEYLWKLNGGVGAPRGADFVDLVRQLAQLAGVDFPERDLTPEQIEAAERRARRRGALEAVYRLCQDTLWSDRGQVARDYLHSRGLPDETIKDLELGLYPGVVEIKRLLDHAGFQAVDGWTELGAWSRLDGYITFPWRDAYGHPLTLYGRWPAKPAPEGNAPMMALLGEGSKSSPLYFDRARRAGHRHIILVAGFLDTALLQSIGETNVAAYVGGAPSNLQLETLKRHGITSVTICPDPDNAGDTGIVSFLKRVDPSIRSYVVSGVRRQRSPQRRRPA